MFQNDILRYIRRNLEREEWILILLFIKGTLSFSQLSEFPKIFHINPANLSNWIGKLENQGLIRRYLSKNVTYFKITEDGADFLEDSINNNNLDIIDLIEFSKFKEFLNDQELQKKISNVLAPFYNKYLEIEKEILNYLKTTPISILILKLSEFASKLTVIEKAFDTLEENSLNDIDFEDVKHQICGLEFLNCYNTLKLGNIAIH